ncbi:MULTISPECIES: type II toxin-antitoxin system Phd/YefM family antitoxin [unclassified Variovorax]|jgi:prevent-host-death family protein|uniref:type II toxin-antitoxin system Phd/YefM family antitoxin n=1 Tax=unclassified Variovorax TaxID=663243 RepID=UPI000F7DB0AE|nr:MULTISPECIES: type II toxin-antitoxin system Phd/YefM family antitoxin [unclassified Variovorax]RSZ47197.1 type II toxin-antitoxin system Phd/YefM family antitoxin [Variovorax sp. 553]RSZ48681.1 type II toxin-antitoxin system Phd/YefM family antitoxin [Variovorax sp. 679]
MNFSTHFKPISYFKNHAADIVKTLSDTRAPLFITQNGEARLVVMDVNSYEEREATLALLKILVLGNHAIEQGQFRSVKNVFADLDRQAAEREENAK